MPFLTEQQAIERLNCSEYQTAFVEEADLDGNWVKVVTDKFTFAFPSEYNVVPRVGDVIKVYSRRTSTRGVDINDAPVYFKTDEEMDEAHKKWVEERNEKQKRIFEEKRTKIDAEYRKLPPIFRKRIRWFRKHNEDFRWKYEAYEMFICTEAVKIAEALKTKNAIQAFMSLPTFEDRKALVDLDEAHSGNSIGMACRLAYHFVNDEEMVFFEHGALVPLVGCNEYGCYHPRPGIEKFASERGWNEQ